MQYTSPHHSAIPLAIDIGTPNDSTSESISVSSNSTLAGLVDGRKHLRQRSRLFEHQSALPFFNETRRTPTLQYVKMALVFCTGLPLLRLVVFLLTVLLVSVWMGVVSLCCHRCGHAMRPGKPAISCGMHALYFPIRVGARVLLWCFGYWWINERYPAGTRAASKCAAYGCGPHYLRRAGRARIVVANHTSFMDALFFGSRFLPTVVGKAGITRIPAVGRIVMLLHPILVPRTPEEKASLPSVVDQIVEKATSGTPARPGPEYEPILIFPEGTTVNQRHVITFQKGAFIPLLPVQPVALDYPFRFLDTSLPPDVPNYIVMARMLFQLYNCMDVVYLPVVNPMPQETPDAFAQRTQQMIAAALGRTNAQYTDKDALFIEVAEHAGIGEYAREVLVPSCGVREAESCLRMHLRLRTLAGIGSTMHSVDKDGSGYLGVGELHHLLQSKYPYPSGSSDTVKSHASLLFQAIDEAAVATRGRISFKDVINCLGIAAHGFGVWNAAATAADTSGHFHPQRLRLCLAALSGCQQQNNTVTTDGVPSVSAIALSPASIARMGLAVSVDTAAWQRCIDAIAGFGGGNPADPITLERLLQCAAAEQQYPHVLRSLALLLDAGAALLWALFDVDFAKAFPERWMAHASR